MVNLVGWENSGVTVIIPESIYDQLMQFYGPNAGNLQTNGTLLLQFSRIKKEPIALLYCKRPDLINWETSGTWESMPPYTPKELFVPGAALGVNYDLSMYATDLDDVQRIIGS